MNWNAVSDAIGAATGQTPLIQSTEPVAGGCIHQAYQVAAGEAVYFVKVNQASFLQMFTAEAEGLQALAQAQALCIPQPICTGVCDSNSFLVLEHLALTSLNAPAQALLGQQLAELHRQTAAQFGWHRDNTIGATPQPNEWTECWSDFYAEQRLQFQFDLAAQNGLHVAGAGTLCDSIVHFFCDYHPQPSLLHGDLWGGNAAMDEQGRPVLFDPACYYGDRETDLAFTEMFGGFGTEFYAAYQQSWPLDAGYQQRKDLYNLYHVLNHYNLFGGGYGAQAEQMVERLLVQT